MNFQIQHFTTNIKYVYLLLSENSQKYKLFPIDISLIFVPIVVYQIASFHRNCYCLPEIAASAIQSAEIVLQSTRNCYRYYIIYISRFLRSTRSCCFRPECPREGLLSQISDKNLSILAYE